VRVIHPISINKILIFIFSCWKSEIDSKKFFSALGSFFDHFLMFLPFEPAADDFDFMGSFILRRSPDKESSLCNTSSNVIAATMGAKVGKQRVDISHSK
jgi:hypothetical protein